MVRSKARPIVEVQQYEKRTSNIFLNSKIHLVIGAFKIYHGENI